MEGLKFKSGGKTLVLLPTGEVADDGTEKVLGKWRSESKGAEARNRLRYDVGGTEQAALPVKYSFNEHNQIVAVVPGAGDGGADGAPYPFRGRIHINDNHDVVYEVFAKDGTQTSNRITVYGDIAFAEKTNDLMLALTGGGEAVVKGTKGANGISVMMAEKNPIAEFKADDLLRFMAFTNNDFGTGPRTAKKALIEFVGKWDMREKDGDNQLVFVSNIVSSGGKNTVSLAFAGKVQAVTFGFAYFADKDGHNLAFNIKGEHKWNETEARWELSLGHTGKKFKAEFAGSITRKGKYGTFALTGAAKIEHESGKKATLSLEIEGVYTFENNKLVFKVDIQTAGGRVTYDLRLEGKFVYKGDKTLTFQVKFSNKNPSPDFSLAITFQSDGDQLKTDLSIVLGKNKNEFTLEIKFEVRLRWKDGVLIKDPPKLQT